MRLRRITGLVGVAALALVAVGCGSDDSEERHHRGRRGYRGAGRHRGPGRLRVADHHRRAEAGQAAAAVGDAGPVRRVLRRGRPGLLREHGLDVEILEGAVDITPQTVLAQGNADFAIAWVPKALPVARAGRRTSPTSPRSSSAPARCRCRARPTDIADPAELAGKKVGNWGFGNEFELFAGMTEAGLDPATDVSLVQQDFDMQALLERRHRRRPGHDLQRVRPGAGGDEPGHGRALHARGLDGHQLERRRHGHAAGRHLGRHREAGLRSGVQGDGHGVREGVDPGVDLLP